MPTILRQLLAVVLGVAVAMLVVTAGDALSRVIHPLPPGLDFSNTDAVRAAIAGMPVVAFLTLVAGWSAAAGIGAWIAARLAVTRRSAMGMLVAGVLVAATAANLAMLPHPTWMWPVALVAVPVAGFVGARAGASTARVAHHR